MYDHTANPTRAAQKFVKEALRELPPQAAKDWNAKLAAQQHDDLQGVFENAASDEELIANIQAVKASDPKVQFLCELRGVVAERLAPDKTVAGIQVEHEFLKPETDLVKQEIENLEREIEALGDEDPDKQVEKRKHFAEALLQAGSHEELETFSTFTDEQLDAYVQKLREQRDELEKDLSAVQRHQPNPALQKALTS